MDEGITSLTPRFRGRTRGETGTWYVRCYRVSGRVARYVDCRRYFPTSTGLPDALALFARFARKPPRSEHDHLVVGMTDCSILMELRFNSYEGRRYWVPVPARNV